MNSHSQQEPQKALFLPKIGRGMGRGGRGTRQQRGENLDFTGQPGARSGYVNISSTMNICVKIAILNRSRRFHAMLVRKWWRSATLRV